MTLESPPVRRGSAFVPHDLRHPIAGCPGGPLAGLTYVAKDMFALEGERCGAGSPEWFEDATPARENAAVIDALHDAGASLVGKTVCDELFYSVTGANADYGTPANPRWPGRLPGGSSSGSAAAVGAGLCDFALGSDTGGSVRIPAAFCGIFGIRTTTGAVDARGAMAMAPSFDAIGWFAPSAGLLRKVGDVLLADGLPPPPVTSVAVPTDVMEHVEGGVASVFDDFRARVNAVFAPMKAAPIYDRDPAEWVECFRVVQAAEVAENYGAWIRSRRPRFGPGIAERIQFALAVDEQSHVGAVRLAGELAAHIRSVVQAGTILLMPTAPCEPPPVHASLEQLDAFRQATMRLTCIAGLGGLPQVALPVGGPDGPLSVSLVGPPQADRQLLDLAVEIEPWIGR